MSKYEVEKSVPLPERFGRGRRYGTSMYPFREMEVGDSFLVPSASPEEGILIGKRIASSATSKALKKEGIIFTVMRVDGGVRCWRIK